MQELLSSLSSPLLLEIVDPHKKPIRSGDMVPISDDNLAEAELSFFDM
jgi:hypothetical protein